MPSERFSNLQVLLSHDKKQSSASNLMTMKEPKEPEKNDFHAVNSVPWQFPKRRFPERCSPKWH
jgi:hypothetical protein